MLYDGYVIAKENNVISIVDSEETLMLEEESRFKMLFKKSNPMVLEKKVNTKPINYADLNRLFEDFSKRFVPQRELSDEQALHPITDQSALLLVKIEAPWELPKNLKAELQAKDTTIKKLKAHIKRINDTSTSESMKKDFDEIKTINIEQEHKVTRLIAENEHLKQTHKQLYDLIKPSRVLSKKQTESLVNQVIKRKDIVTNAGQMSNAATIAPGMYKLDPIILAPKVKNNREAHEYYLKHTMEQAAILIEIVEQAKSRNPLNSASYSAYMYVKLIQELLGVNPSTSANGLNPSGNTKNDRIPRTPSSNEKNKVEVQSRKVKSSLNKRSSDSKNVCNEHVKHHVKGAKALCSVCNECLFDANHAMCLIDHVKSMNVRAKSASKKNKKRKEWKPIGKVFNSVGYKWKPTKRTFTLVEYACPLTRITATNKVPLRVPIPLQVVAPKHVVTRVYTRRPKVPKFVHYCKPKVAKSMTANKMKPDTSRGSDTSVAPSSSSLIDCRLSKLFCGVTPPKKARKFKKPASPKLFIVPASPDEPIRKLKRVKRPAKKSSDAPTACVVIRETLVKSLSKKKEKMIIEKRKGIDFLSKVALTEEARYEEVRKKSLRDFHKTHPSGSGTVTKTAPRVSDVTEEESTESAVESWGKDEDDSNNEHDSRSEGSDQERDSGDDKAQSDSEKGSDFEHETDKNELGSESDQEENEEEDETDEEEKNEEFVRTPSNDTDDEDETKIKDKVKGDADKGLDYTINQFDNNVNVSLNEPVDIDEGFIQKDGTDAKMTNVQQGNENPEICQVIEDAYVTLSTIPRKTEVPVTSSSHSSDLASKFLNFSNIPHIDAKTISPMDVHVHHEILPNEVSNFAPLVIQSMVTESLEHAVLARESSQPKSTYEVASSLIEFELKKILINKMDESQSYLTAPEHRECYDGLIKSYDLNKSLFSTYDKVYSLKRIQKDKDKDED
ncbi:hypothetical protein Tco_0183286 [Tanacetum coccineum]